MVIMMNIYILLLPLPSAQRTEYILFNQTDLLVSRPCDNSGGGCGDGGGIMPLMPCA